MAAHVQFVMAYEYQLKYPNTNSKKRSPPALLNHDDINFGHGHPIKALKVVHHSENATHMFENWPRAQMERDASKTAEQKEELRQMEEKMRKAVEEERRIRYTRERQIAELNERVTQMESEREAQEAERKKRDDAFAETVGQMQQEFARAVDQEKEKSVQETVQEAEERYRKEQASWEQACQTGFQNHGLLIEWSAALQQHRNMLQLENSQLRNANAELSQQLEIASNTLAQNPSVRDVAATENGEMEGVEEGEQTAPFPADEAAMDMDSQDDAAEASRAAEITEMGDRLEQMTKHRNSLAEQLGISEEQRKESVKYENELAQDIHDKRREIADWKAWGMHLSLNYPQYSDTATAYASSAKLPPHEFHVGEVQQWVQTPDGQFSPVSQQQYPSPQSDDQIVQPTSVFVRETAPEPQSQFEEDYDRALILATEGDEYAQAMVAPDEEIRYKGIETGEQYWLWPRERAEPKMVYLAYRGGDGNDIRVSLNEQLFDASRKFVDFEGVKDINGFEGYAGDEQLRRIAMNCAIAQLPECQYEAANKAKVLNAKQKKAYIKRATNSGTLAVPVEEQGFYPETYAKIVDAMSKSMEFRVCAKLFADGHDMKEGFEDNKHSCWPPKFVDEDAYHEALRKAKAARKTARAKAAKLKAAKVGGDSSVDVPMQSELSQAEKTSAEGDERNSKALQAGKKKKTASGRGAIKSDKPAQQPMTMTLSFRPHPGHKEAGGVKKRPVKERPAKQRGVEADNDTQKEASQ